ncbi:hypothetical protein FHG87_001282 [Trinorchestia longiramus]|nr:hypothetical protein FHG87_001282 [Trinorchestia longiramus]
MESSECLIDNSLGSKKSTSTTVDDHEVIKYPTSHQLRTEFNSMQLRESFPQKATFQTEQVKTSNSLARYLITIGDYQKSKCKVKNKEPEGILKCKDRKPNFLRMFAFAPHIGSVAVMMSLLLLCGTVDAKEDRDVAELSAASDFNGVRLQWRYPRSGSHVSLFRVTHCEDQAWGPHRCRNIMLQPNELVQTPLNDGTVKYSSKISHLRMATNYTFEVTPVDEDDQEVEGKSVSPGPRGRAIPDPRPREQVFVQTKGFSARALSCLTNSTQIEVETGPHFGGKISVEGSTDPACAVHGNAASSVTKYKLDINHALCGSTLLGESVRTYILVQENLPILTHSTRRFMVVCHYVPESFTVSAGVSLPENPHAPPLIPVDQSVNEVDPSELFDSSDNLFNNRQGRRSGKALKLEQDSSDQNPKMWTQLVLMLILVVGAVVGLSCAFWHFGKHAGFTAWRKNASSDIETLSSPAEDLEAIERASTSNESPDNSSTGTSSGIKSATSNTFIAEDDEFRLDQLTSADFTPISSDDNEPQDRSCGGSRNTVPDSGGEFSVFDSPVEPKISCDPVSEIVSPSVGTMIASSSESQEESETSLTEMHWEKFDETSEDETPILV